MSKPSSSSSGSAAAKQLMRGLFLRPTSFQISNIAQSLALLHHFHRLAQRADAAAAAAARQKGESTRNLEHGGVYSVFVPRNLLQQRPLRWSYATVSPAAARSIAPPGLPTIHNVKVPRASALHRSHIGLRDIQPYVGLPLTPEEESMLDGLAHDEVPWEDDDEGPETWYGRHLKHGSSSLGGADSATDGASAGERTRKFVDSEDGSEASRRLPPQEDTVTIEVKAELAAEIFPRSPPVTPKRKEQMEADAARFFKLFDGFASSTQQKARAFCDNVSGRQGKREAPRVRDDASRQA